MAVPAAGKWIAAASNPISLSLPSAFLARCRLGSDRTTSFWYSTGYRSDWSQQATKLCQVTLNLEEMMAEISIEELKRLHWIENMACGVVESFRRNAAPDDFLENVEWLEYAIYCFGKKDDAASLEPRDSA